MTNRTLVLTLAAGSVLVAPAIVGCEALPGRPREQGAVIGAVAGGIIGAAAAGTWWAGALIGAGIGLVGGWVIGFAIEEWFGPTGVAERTEMRTPMDLATPEQALAARTADINGDGQVSIDELLAMHHAGLTEMEIMRRLEATDCIFELTNDQEFFLLSHGVSPRIVRALPDVNLHVREQRLAQLQEAGAER